MKPTATLFLVAILCTGPADLALAQKVKVTTEPANATLYLNASKVSNPKTVNIGDPNISLVAALSGFGTAALKPLDLRGEGITEHTMVLEQLNKPGADYKGARIEFSKLIDRTGQIEKPSVPTGWYGTTTTATDFEDAQFTTAITGTMGKYGCNVVGGNTMFKNDRDVPDFGLGAEVLWIGKGTAGSGFQIALHVKWSVYSVEEEKVVYEKVVGAYSDSRSTNKFNDELAFALEDATRSLVGTKEFQDMVSADKVKAPASAQADAITIAKVSAKNSADYSGLVKECMASTVTVKTNFGFGSGFVIADNGYILTNYHVIKGAEKIEAIFNNGFSFVAEEVRTNKDRDIALIKIPGSGFKPIPLGAGEAASDVGEEVLLIGTPKSVELGQTVTKGIISGKRTFEEKPYIQTDVAVNAGNSGGPLINIRTGEVVGVIVAKVVDSGVEGLGFAIPIEDCRKALNLVTE
ncbi:MAG: trypsin-like peptidase domain-containing protein [Flavobacteriales bacterium]|nr:trypsin-like peptidase domain-containing protein [Flavobacteriales bacterium]